MTQQQPKPDQLLELGLGGLYRPEAILACSAEVLSRTQVSVAFIFPKYDRGLVQPDHVSAVQIEAALIEGGYCLIAHAIREGLLPAAIDLARFRDTRPDWLIAREERKYERLVRAGERVSLILELAVDRPPSLSARFLGIDFTATGFVNATQTWLLPLEKLGHS